MPGQPGRSACTPYGSARDLPSYREMSRQLQGGKRLTLFIARDQRNKLIEIEAQVERLVRVVDDFYDRLGPRNWIFHELLSVDSIEHILAETPDAASAEQRLIDLYRDPETLRRWVVSLNTHDGLRNRIHQIDRARDHYDAGQFDSCTLHLIAVMDGFVNDLEPGERKGLHSRDPDDMAAWDSTVGHHLGLAHAMATFTKTIKKRVDDEVFEVYRHGIIHGSVVNFDNVIVATKAWNMLFAVADWATATRKAAEPKKQQPTWRDTCATLTRQAVYEKYKRGFVPSTVESASGNFASDEMVMLASEFLDAWKHRRWGLVAKFTPPILVQSSSDGHLARLARDTFSHHHVQNWSIESVAYDQPSVATVHALATVNGEEAVLRFRMVFRDVEGNVAIPRQDTGSWSLAHWAPHTYFGLAG